MILIICIVALIVGILLWNWDDVNLITWLVCSFGICGVICSVILLFTNYVSVDADFAKYTERYNSLVYQYENNLYDNDNDVGLRDLLADIEYWNCDLAERQTMSHNFWIGIYYPNIYDQFKFIELNKGE